MRHTLNHRQERFVLEYLKDQNASAAAIRAGYSGRTRGSHAAELMRNPLIQERVRLGLADLYAALNITAVSLLRQQARAAFFDPVKLFDAAGRPLPLAALDPEVAAVLTVHYDERPNGEWVKRVRQPSRQAALAALERRYAQFLAMQTAEPACEAPPDEAWAGAPAPDASPAPKVDPNAIYASGIFRAPATMAARGAASAALPGAARSSEPGGPVGPVAKPAERAGTRAAAMRIDQEVATVGATGAARLRADADDASGGAGPAAVASGAPASRDSIAVGAAAVVATDAPFAVHAADAECLATDSDADCDADYDTDSDADADANADADVDPAPMPPRAADAPPASAQRAPAPPAPVEEPEYDFRKDPNWMWGGRHRPKPAPAPEPPQPVATLPPNFRVRAGAVVPAAYPPGYNPPWLRRDRPQYAETGSVFGDD